MRTDINHVTLPLLNVRNKSCTLMRPNCSLCKPFCATNRFWRKCRVRCGLHDKYKGRLQSSWTHLVTPSGNFVEVWWRSIFRSTSLGKRCTSYNAPLTSRKRAADRWSLRNFLPRSSIFKDGKAQKSHGARHELNSAFGLEKVNRWNSIRTSAIQSRSRPMRFANSWYGPPACGLDAWLTIPHLKSAACYEMSKRPRIWLKI
jgi:hypothetical protein